MADRTDRSWWQRNWIWVAGTSVILLGVALFVAALLVGIAGTMKSSHVYREALTRAQASSMVVEFLGKPVEPGLFVTGLDLASPVLWAKLTSASPFTAPGRGHCRM